LDSLYSWDRATRSYKPRADDDDLPMTTFGPLGDYGYHQVMGEDVADPFAGKRHTFVVPDGWEALRDANGRATGKIRCRLSGEVRDTLAPNRPPDNDNVHAGDRKSRAGTYVSTYTGRFWPFDPRPDDFDIVDVAHGLSMLVRYTGAVRRFYSVAEHSWHIAGWLRDNYGPVTALAGLLHDAPEALSGFADNARPSKRHAPIIKETEENIWRRAIAPKFGLDVEMPDAVHEADNRIVADEMQQNMHEVDPDYREQLGVRLQCWAPDIAKAAFLSRFKALTAVICGEAAA
jgi:hypothetical protein